MISSSNATFLGAPVFFDQIGGLLERHVAIVVAVDPAARVSAKLAMFCDWR